VSGLYTRDILRLAVASADFPPLSQHDARVNRRAPLCGSEIVLDLRLDAGGRIAAIGFTVHACAIGQAAAVLLARHAAGRDAAALAAVHGALARWLDDVAAAQPDWPDIAMLAGVRAFPARRGAALLPFAAAAAAMATATARSAA
jgi:NifU-like protein involved in Fe-S cluster formation